MTITRDEAWTKLCEWTETEALRKHAGAVEIVMRAAAHRYGAGAEDEEAWGVAGMLHDADYEKWPEEHPHKIVGWLRERGEERIAHAISAHYTSTCSRATRVRRFSRAISSATSGGRCSRQRAYARSVSTRCATLRAR